MKKVIYYKDNNGGHWSTEEDALLSDSKTIVKNCMRGYSADNFDFEEWINNIKRSPEFINALLHVLEVDLTDIQAERLLKRNKKNELGNV